MENFHTRKQKRTEYYYENIHGVSRKKVKCEGCGGSGYYDALRDGKPIVCGECDGEGLVIKVSITSKYKNKTL